MRVRPRPFSAAFPSAIPTQALALAVIAMLFTIVNCQHVGRDCAPFGLFLRTRNLVEPLLSTTAPGSVCGGQCCSESTEKNLKTAVRKDLEALLRHHAISLHGLFATTATTLQSHVLELARLSENKTLYLFHQVYSKMSVLSRKPINGLYSDIRSYIQNSSDVTNSPDLNIEKSVIDFFTNLFPLVYHHAVTSSHNSDFTKEYKLCLKEAVTEIQPFSDIPKQISHTLYKSLETTRVLLQALALGSEVLNTTDTLLSEGAEKTDASQNACHVALLKMSYCPKCMGFNMQLKPCSGYCLNVLRGCLTQHVSELDLPWNSYVEAVERLVITMRSLDTSVNIDKLLRELDTKISEAIMYAMENGPTLEKKVKRACGHAVFFKEDSAEESLNNKNNSIKIEKSNRILPVLDTQMLHFVASVSKSKSFFLNLADTLCHDESYAEQEDSKECWNGERIGEYTKTVVGSSVSLQKYNPEVEPSAKVSNQGVSNSDDRIVKLSHRLKHMRQLVLQQTSTYPLPVSESFMQGDMAENDNWEGSGSGTKDQEYEDVDDETRWREGSGSGDNHIEEISTPTVHVENGGDKFFNIINNSSFSLHGDFRLLPFVLLVILFISARKYLIL